MKKTPKINTRYYKIMTFPINLAKIRTFSVD